MTLYDFMGSAYATQFFHVYVGNAYGQNLEIGHGTRRDIADEYLTEEGYYHLADQVERWYVCDYSNVVVVTRDKNFNVRCEELFDEEYVKKWDRWDPETRPWKHDAELER
jgi:hypothetical protein